MIIKMRKIVLKTTAFLIIFLLSACNSSRPGQSLEDTTTAPDTSPSATTVAPPQDSASGECGFMWANKALPELSKDFNQALQEVLPESEGYVQAYGENCVTETGEVVRFLTMESDFYITLKVEDPDDKEALGELVEEVMSVMAQFPTDETPGPQPGYIGITFEAPGESLRLWTMRRDIEVALENGLRGEELFNALQSK